MAKQINKLCVVCGTPFKGRKDAKTCSPTCRKRLQRQNGLKEKLIDEAKKLEQAAVLDAKQIADSLLPHEVELAPIPIGFEDTGSLDAPTDSGVDDTQSSEAVVMPPVYRPTVVNEDKSGKIDVKNVGESNLTDESDIKSSPEQKYVKSSNLPEINLDEDHKKVEKLRHSVRRVAAFASLGILLVGLGLLLTFRLGNNNLHSINRLNSSQSQEAKKQKNSVAYINTTTNGLELKVEKLSELIKHLPVASNSGSGTVVENASSTLPAEINATSVDGTTVNGFNGPDELVLLNDLGQLPPLDGSNLYNVDAQTLEGDSASYFTDATNLTTGTLSDSLLSSNVALLNGHNNFEPTTDSTNAFSIQNSSGSLTLFNVDTTGSGQVSFGSPVVFNSTDVLNSLGSSGNTSLCLNAQNEISGCSGSGGSGVTSLNTLVGGVTIANATTAGSVISLNDASTTQLGLSQFNSNDFTVSSGDVSTIQPIDSSATPTFAGLTVNGNASVSGNLTLSNFGTAGVLTNTNTGLVVSSPTLSDSFLNADVTTQGNSFNGSSELVQLNGSGDLPALNGSNLTNLDATNITTGTLSDNQLSANVTVQGNSFNGANELVQLNNTGLLPALNASNLTNLTASNLTGSLTNGEVGSLNANITLQGNTFNGNSELVQLNSSGALPALNAANLTNLTASNLTGSLTNNQVGNLNANITLQGNTFNGSSELVELASNGDLPALNGSNLTSLDASNLTSGTIGSGEVSGSYTGITAVGTLTGLTDSGNLTVQGSSGVNVGVSGSTPGVIVLNTAGSGAVTISSASQSNAVALSIPADSHSSDTFCLETLDNCSSFSGATAGGDLTGSYPDPMIASLQGVTLTITNGAGLSSGQILQYNGSAFVNQTVTGDVTINGSGVTAIGAGKVTNTDLANSSLTITAGTGLSGGGSVALGGSSPALNVQYGSTSGTAVQGNASFTCASGTGNLTGGGTAITEGSGGTCGSLNTVNNPSFSGTVTDSDTGANAVDLQGMPLAGTSGATSSLLELGNTITGGNNTATTGGTFIGINEPNTGAGSAADFLDLQHNGTIELQVTSGGAVTATSFAGNGSGLTSLNASNISSGTLSDSYLNANVTVQGNTFNGNSELVETNSSGQLPAISGVNLTSLNASNITSGTLSDSYLNANVTTQGNTFNGNSQLVQLTSGGLLPTLNASNLTNLNGANLTSGSVANSALANSSINFGSGTNTTASAASVALGGTVSINVVNNPSFSGQLADTDSGTNALLIQGTPLAGSSGATSSLVQLGPNTIHGGNSTATTGGTFIGINEPNTGAGSTADFINFQNNNNVELQVTSGGAVTATSFSGNGSGLTSLNASNISSGTLSDSYLNANVTIQGNTFNGANQLVELNGSGYLPVLNGSNLTNLSGGNITAGTVANSALTNSSLTITAGTGLSGGGSVALGGSSPALNVQYGSTSGTAVQGNASFTCASGTGNLTGGGTAITEGSGGTCGSLNTVNNPSFSGTVTLGSASSSNGTEVFDNASNNDTITLQAGSTAAYYALTLPTNINGDSNDCLQLGTVSGSGTSGTPYSAALGFGTCGSGGTLTVGALNGGTANSNGATISSSVLYLQSASTSNPGLVSTTSQSLVGYKTFTSGLAVTSTTATNTFAVQNASSYSDLNLDNFNGDLAIGSPYTTPVVLGSGFTGNGSPPNGSTTSLGSGSNCGVAEWGGKTAVSPTGEVILVGGHTSSSAVTNVVCYAQLNNGGNGTITAWDTATALPEYIGDASVVAYNGYVYVFGGVGGSTSTTLTDQSAIYSAPISQFNLGSSSSSVTWTLVGNINTGGSSPTNYALEQASAQVNNGYVYLLGGVQGGVVQSTLFYAPLTSSGGVGSWTESTIPASLAGAASAVFNNYLFLIGGSSTASCSSSGSQTDYSAPIYTNGNIGPWTNQGNHGPGNYGSDAVVDGGYAHILTNNGTPGSMCSPVYGFSLKLGSTGTTPSYTQQLTNGPGVDGAEALYGTVIYLIGGQTGGAGVSTVDYDIPNSATSNGSAGSGGQNINLNVYGGETIQTGNNTPSAFIVQNSSGNNLLGVDTNSPTVNVGFVGSVASSSTINIGTSTAAAQTINIGTSNTSAGTIVSLFSGTNGITISSSGVAIQGTFNLSGGLTLSSTLGVTNTTQTTNTSAFYVQNASSVNEINLDSLDGNLSLGTPYTTLPNVAVSQGASVGAFTAYTSGQTLSSTCGGVYGNSAIYIPNLTSGIGEIISAGGNGSGGPQTAVCFTSTTNSSDNLGSNTWTSSSYSLLSGTPVYDAGTVYYDGYMYVLGGLTTNSATSSTSVIQSAPVVQNSEAGISSNFSSTSTSLPMALDNAAVTSNDGYVYVIGGDSAGTSESTAYYAPLLAGGKVGSFISTTSLPAKVVGAATVVNNGYIYVIDGSTSNTCNNATSTIYFAALNANGTIGSWSTTTSNTYARYQPSAVVYQNNLVILGGSVYSGSNCLSIINSTNTANGGEENAILNANGTISAQTAGQTVWTSSTNGTYEPYITNSSVNYSLFNSQMFVLSGGSTFNILSVGGGYSKTGPEIQQNSVEYGALTLTSGNTTSSSGSGGQSVNVGVTGSETIQTPTNTSSALQVQNSQGTSLLNVDSINDVTSSNEALSVIGGVSISGLSTPVISASSTGGTGTSYQYRVSAVNGNGTYTAASSAAITSGASSLSSPSVYNSITWPAVSGASMYYVYRVYDAATPTNIGYIGTVLNNNPTSNNTYTFLDYGNTASNSNGATASVPYPTIDTSGQLSANGTALFKNATNSTSAFQIQNSTGTQELDIDTSGNNVNLGSSATPLNAWQTGSSFTPSLAGIASVSYQGYVYVVGDGSAVYYSQIGSSGSMGSWQTNSYALGCTTMGCGSPVSLSYMNVVTNGGYIYVLGGGQSTVYYAQLLASGGTGPWHTGTNNMGSSSSGCASSATLSFSTATAYNGYVYVMGGALSGTSSPQAYIYSAQLTPTGTGAWTCTAGGTYAPAFNGASSFGVGGYLYVLGGDSSTYNNILNGVGTTTQEIYYAQVNSNGSLGTWSNSSTLPSKLEGSNVVTQGNSVYIMGGDTNGGAGNDPSNNVYNATVSAGSFGSWSTNSFPGNEYGAGTIYNGYMYYMAGLNGSDTATNASYYSYTGEVNVSDNASFNSDLYALGNFSVQGQATFSQYASFLQNVGIAGNLTVGGSVLANGSTLFEDTTNSTTAFQIDNSSGSQLLVADTTNQDIGIGLAPASGDATLQVEGSIDIDGTGAALKINGTVVCSNTAGSGMTSGCSGSGSGSSSYIQNQTSGAQTANFYIQDTVGSTNTIEAAASGTADILDLDNGSGTKVAVFDKNGDLTLTNNLTVNGTTALNGSSNTITAASATAFVIQNSSSSGIQLLTANTSSLTLTISGASTISGTSSYATLNLSNTRVESTQTSGDIPTMGTPSGCGTSPSKSVTSGSTDSAGSFTITTGTGTQAAGCNVSFSFYEPYSSTPKSIIIAPANTGASELGGGGVETGTASASGFTFIMPKGSASTAYEYYYWVVE